MTKVDARLSAALEGRYRIARELGAGGMATVYLAEDLKHDRKVAIKVLKPELAAVLGAERFVVEIKTTAALSHPHILPLFDSGTADGFLFYVMPYIEGETIREKLNRETQFGVDEAVRIAREVADALDYAHRHGVIHRDIKPENILLHDGRAMVMDFGIALAVSAAAGGRMTETGLSLGTPHYMSPEQATAEKEITPRSDIYSLASVLYEMLAGQPPHMGGAAQQVIMKIITETAQPVTTLRKSVPPNVSTALAKALEKLPADRFENAKAFAEALTNAGFTANGHARGAFAATARRRPPGMVIAGIATVALIAFLVGRYARTGASGESRATFSSIEPAQDERWTFSGTFFGFAPSPDGRRIALASEGPDSSGIVVRSLDSLGLQRLPRTKGAMAPFWSPDGRSLGYFADGQMKVYEISSGAIRSLCPAASPGGATWGRNDVIIYSPESGRGVFRTLANGHECSPLNLRGVSGARPQFLGDGEHFVVSSTEAAWIAKVGDDSASLLAAFDGTSQQAVVGLPDYLLFTPRGAERQSYHAQRIDVSSRRLVGPVVPLLRGVRGGSGRTALWTGAGGTMLVQLTGLSSSHTGRFQGGVLRETTTTPGFVFSAVRATGNGRQFVVGGFRVSTWDPRRNVWTDLVAKESPPVPSTSPVWSPADTSVAFRTGRTIVVVRVSDQSKRVFLTDSVRSRQEGILDWSRDGRVMALLYSATDGARFPEPWALDVATGERHRMFQETGAVTELRFSPDGHRVAYDRGLGTDGAIFVRPFPGPGAAVRIVPGQASRPRWSPNGRSLYFEDGDGNIAVVLLNAAGEATGAPTIAISKERIEQLHPGYGSFQFDVATATGDVFVIAGGSRRQSLTLVQNWPALLERKP